MSFSTSTGMGSTSSGGTSSSTLFCVSSNAYTLCEHLLASEHNVPRTCLHSLVNESLQLVCCCSLIFSLLEQSVAFGRQCVPALLQPGMCESVIESQMPVARRLTFVGTRVQKRDEPSSAHAYLQALRPSVHSQERGAGNPLGNAWECLDKSNWDKSRRPVLIGHAHEIHARELAAFLDLALQVALLVEKIL